MILISMNFNTLRTRSNNYHKITTLNTRITTEKYFLGQLLTIKITIHKTKRKVIRKAMVIYLIQTLATLFVAFSLSHTLNSLVS